MSGSGTKGPQLPGDRARAAEAARGGRRDQAPAHAGEPSPGADSGTIQAAKTGAWSRRAGQIAWAVLALAGVVLLLIFARGPVTSLLIACAIAYVCEPLVDGLERWKVPRSLAIVLLWMGMAGLVAAMGLWIVPKLVDQGRQFVASLDLETLRGRLEPLLGSYTGGSAELLLKVRDKALAYLQENALDLAGPAFQTLGSVAATGIRVVARVFEAILIPVLSFYLLRDSHALKRRFQQILPPRMRVRALDLLAQIDAVLRRFIRGQVLISAMLGFLYSVGFVLLGTPLAVPIGVLGGVASLVPYGGVAFSLAMGLLFSFLQYGSWIRLLLTVLVIGTIQIFEGAVISPRILGESTGLHPVVVLFSLMVGGAIFGLPGMLAAVPVTAAAAVLLRAGLEDLRKTWS